jgi:Alcohol dehydrogenase, class IV
MDSFRYEVLESRVIFGIGAISEVKKEAHELGAKKALVISSPEQAELAHEAATLLEELCADVHPEAVQHVPVEKVHSAVERVRSLKIDCLVAIGGGSAIGLAKAVALQSSVPILAVPTTYAGSEMTPIWGITENGLKKTGKIRRSN